MVNGALIKATVHFIPSGIKRKKAVLQRTVFFNLKLYSMITVFFIGRQDDFQKILDLYLSERDIKITHLLKPSDEFNLLEAQTADVIIADVEDEDYGFKRYELVEVVREIFPSAKIIGINNRNNKRVSDKVKELNANGYFGRDATDLKLILDCITDVSKGKPHFKQ